MTGLPIVATARLEVIDGMLLSNGWTQDDIGWLAPEDFRSALAGHIGHGHLSRSHAIAAQVQFDEALIKNATKAGGAA
jgi:hypothetical protein